MQPARPDETGREPGHPLIEALVDQLAASQTETLYGLHSAAATLRRRAAELEQAVTQLPDELAPQLSALIATLVEHTTAGAMDNAEALMAELRQSVATETRLHADALIAVVQASTTAVTSSLQHLTSELEATATEQSRAANEAANRAAAERQSLSESITTSLELHQAAFATAAAQLTEAQAQHTHTEQHLEAARTSLEATTQDAIAQLYAATEKCATHLQGVAGSVGAQLAALAEPLTVQITQAAQTAVAEIESATDIALARLEHGSARLEGLAGLVADGADLFTANAAAATEALERVGENVIDRLIAVLDDRDKRDKKLEDRIAARTKKLTDAAEAQLQSAVAELKAQSETQLNEVLNRLLDQPRGKLKQLRNKENDA